MSAAHEVPEAERAILGCMLIEREAIPRAIAIAPPEEFSNPTYRAIYSAVLRLFERSEPVEYDTVAVEIGADREEISGVTYLINLAQGVATAANVGFHAKRVHEAYLLRRIRTLTDVSAQAQDEGRDEEARQAFQEIARLRLMHEHRPAFFDADEAIERIVAAREGLPTAWSGLNGLGVSFDPGALNIVAASTSSGKTTLQLWQVLDWLRTTDTGCIVFWSSEMNRDHLFARLVGMIAGTSMGDVLSQTRRLSLSPEVFAALEEFRRIASHRLVLLDEPVDATTFGRRVEALHAETGVLVAFVDYLQQMPPVAANDPLAGYYAKTREQAVAQTVVMLRQLAQRIEIPVIAAAQLNREAAKAADYVPSLAHLRESGQIEQEASVVLALRNANMTRLSAASAVGQKLAGADVCYASHNDEDLQSARLGALAACDDAFPGRTLLEVFVLKNRANGRPQWVAPLAMDGRTGRIEDLSWRYGRADTPQTGKSTRGKRDNGRALRERDDDAGWVPVPQSMA